MESIKPIHQFADELLIGNELVYRQTDIQTDRPTSSKTIYPLFFVGEHNNWDSVNKCPRLQNRGEIERQTDRETEIEAEKQR
ncbi:hypothetical protein DPMN_176903 [Dreissena polymorpha]|uniref:Uncharacterized protein n=1 Tax=Dreissena polymorpha TaxID=45954 RepID=A0A9D4EBX5_DREPO|nr:hypothetical protein DPMN_176903 [Dreissena polymorpha]